MNPGRRVVPAAETIPCPGTSRLHMLRRDFLFVHVMVWHPQLVLTAGRGGGAAGAPSGAGVFIYIFTYLQYE